MSQEKTQAGMVASLDAFLTQYATPLSAAMFAVVGITGVLMFFRLYKGELEGIHEWIGLVFAAAVLAHLLRNRRAFVFLLRQTRMRVLLLVVAAGSLGVIALSPPKTPNPFRQVTQRVLAAPISDVAPALGMTREEAITRLRDAGAMDAAADQSIGAIAEQYKKDPMSLLAVVMTGRGNR